MNKYIKFSALFLCFLFPGLVHAGQEAQQFSLCLSDSMSGKERKHLAKWIFLGMSVHSTLKPYANVPESDMDASNKYIGKLITRLITEDCPDQAKAAYKVLGASAFEQAFKVAGEVAMQEIMMEPGVGQALGAFEKYLDSKKINSLFP